MSAHGKNRVARRVGADERPMLASCGSAARSNAHEFAEGCPKTGFRETSPDYRRNSASKDRTGLCSSSTHRGANALESPKTLTQTRLLNGERSSRINGYKSSDS